MLGKNSVREKLLRKSHLKFPLLKSFLSVLQMIILLSEGDEILKSIKNYLTWMGDRKKRDEEGK